MLPSCEARLLLFGDNDVPHLPCGACFYVYATYECTDSRIYNGNDYGCHWKPKLGPDECAAALTCINSICNVDFAKEKALQLIKHDLKCGENTSNAAGASGLMTVSTTGVCVAVLVYVCCILMN